MKKAQLIELPVLKATVHMMKLAAEDELKYSRVKIGSDGSNEKGYKYGLYLRCKVFDNILKVAIFYPEHMRSGGKLPVFEVYVDSLNQDFITYNYMDKKWMTSKLDMITWPKYVWYSEGKWISPRDGKLVQTFLGVEHTGYRGVLDFQMQVRKQALKRRHKKETDPWDLAMEQTPELPKDWNQWVCKVGIPENFIFYKYVKRGAKTGYCTYCEKDVPIRNPKHNKMGTCPVYRHKIQYKSEDKAGTVITPTVDTYLIQRCEDGFMIRNFHAHKRFDKCEYRNPKFLHGKYDERSAIKMVFRFPLITGVTTNTLRFVGSQLDSAIQTGAAAQMEGSTERLCQTLPSMNCGKQVLWNTSSRNRT